MPSSPIHELSDIALRSLATALEKGALSYSISNETLLRTLPSITPEASTEIIFLHENAGWSPAQLSHLLESIVEARSSKENLSHVFDLVLSGPKSEAVHSRDTQAVFHEIVETAQSEIFIASYAIYNGKSLFAPLIKKQHENSEFRTSIFLDIPRKHGDRTTAEQLIAAYKQDFCQKQWPGAELPDLYYLCASLELDWKARASMHAKITIADRKTMMITSANLTKAAQTKNIEVGAIIDDPRTAERIINHFHALTDQGIFLII